MRLFKRKSSKSGYCNISEPVSDLDPARISVIKAQHSKLQATAAEAKSKITSSQTNDDTFVTETVTLDTSPSAESSKSRQEAISSSARSTSSDADNDPIPISPDSNNNPLIRELSPQNSNTESAWAPTPKSNVTSMAVSKPIIDAKITDSFFQGRNRKRVLNCASQAPSTKEDVAIKDMLIPTVDADQNQENPLDDDTQSQNSDVDKSFEPQIVSVNSDITDPSYGASSRKSSQQQTWKNFRKVRRYLHDSTNSKEKEGPSTILETIIDAICSYPGEKKS